MDIESFTGGWEGLSNKLNAEKERVADSLALALDAAQMGQWDLDLVHDNASRSLRHDQIFGYPALQSKWGWRDFMEHVVPEDRNAVTEQFQNASQKGATFNIECRIVWADQSTHWIAAQGRAYLNDQGAPVRIAGVVMDISARKQAEQDLRRSRDELELRVQERTAELARSNTELEQFAYIASHDLQEPLRKVQAFGDMLVAQAGAALGEEGRDYLQRMQNAASRMQALINDLLSFARVTSQAKAFVPVDLAKVAQEVVSDLETRIKSSGGQIEIGELPCIDSDSLQMRQLLQNLIGNALKFYRPDVPPVVTVWSKIVKRGANGAVSRHSAAALLCELTVQDNGIGFEEKYLDRIFTPFQRLHGRGEYEGTGMGLAICRKIVERHGGTITARSAPGQGATFIVTLPLQQRKDPQHV